MGSAEEPIRDETRTGLFERLYPELERRLALQLSGSQFDPDTIAEIIQEVILRTLDKWDGRAESLWPFMKSALKFVVFEALRAVAAQRELVTFEGAGADSYATSATSPGRKVMRRDLIAKLRAEAGDATALAIYYMKMVGKLTFDQIAAETGLTVDDVKRRFYRIRDEFERRFGGEDI